MESTIKVYTIDQHDQLLHIWRKQSFEGLHVIHVDYHCDMRGLLVDRNAQLGWQIPEVRKTLDEGNFLRYAIFEGIVDAVTWVHGTPGGREDDLHTVKYTTDFSGRRMRKRLSTEQAKPLGYQVIELDSWQGLPADSQEKLFLDIDWDTFADESIPEHEVEDRANRFFDYDLEAKLVGASVCYSPYHSHQNRELYNQFVERLASRISANIEAIQYQPGTNELPLRKRLIPSPLYNFLQRNYHTIRLYFKRRGLY